MENIKVNVEDPRKIEKTVIVDAISELEPFNNEIARLKILESEYNKALVIVQSQVTEQETLRDARKAELEAQGAVVEKIIKTEEVVLESEEVIA